MTPAARLSAAIELIETIDAQRVPAAKALKEWGTAHRYAGSGDRAAIAGLIWDVLRRRASSAWLMDADTPRARVLGMMRLERGMTTEAISNLCHGERFAPEPLSGAERSALTSRSLDDAPPHVAGDYPEWLDAHLAKVFGDDSTVHRWFQRWNRNGVMKAIWAELVSQCEELEGVDWEWQSADGSMGKARFGGALSGATPRIAGKTVLNAA